jgi:hypothetical protein
LLLWLLKQWHYFHLPQGLFLSLQQV